MLRILTWIVGGITHQVYLDRQKKLNNAIGRSRKWKGVAKSKHRAAYKAVSTYNDLVKAIQERDKQIQVLSREVYILQRELQKNK